MSPRVLIACIGNIFLGDDGFGVEVARRLLARPLPEGVRVVDFGIRGFDLTFALLDDLVDVVILVDAAPRGEPAGTLYVIEPESDEAGEPEPGELLIDPHSMDPAKVLRLAKVLGAQVKRVLLVGCEPGPIATDPDFAPGLSEPVQLAVDGAIEMIDSLIEQIRTTDPVAVTEKAAVPVMIEGRP
jgi:hydrogenase maturation protease